MPKFSDNLDKLGVLSRMSRLDKVENLSSLSKAPALYIYYIDTVSRLYIYCITLVNVRNCPLAVAAILNHTVIHWAEK